MNPTDLANQASATANRALELAAQARLLAEQHVAPVAAAAEPFLLLLTIFLLACFVGYYVVWNVTPALHSPLMGVTNAISSVIVVGALLAVSVEAVGGVSAQGWTAKLLGFAALIMASVNIFGGFLVTQRMLGMYQKKKK